MKRKLIIGILSISLIATMGGCSNKSKDNITENKGIIIDEDAKATSEKGKELDIKKIATFKDFLSPYDINEKKNNKSEKDIKSQMTFLNGNILFFTSKDHSNIIQFPEFKIEEAKIGEVLLESSQGNEYNDVKWRDIENIQGTLLTGYLKGISGIRINNNNKVYSMNSNGDVKEIKSYQKIFEKGINPIHYVGSDDGRLDIFEVTTIKINNSENSRNLYIIDSKNDNYYEASIEGEGLGGIEVLAVENNKIYVKTSKNGNDFKVGYIEENKFKEIISSETDLKVKLSSNMIYSNNHILFLGEVSGKPGLYNMDLSNNTMKMEYDINGYGTLVINSKGDKIAIYTSKLENEMDGNSKGDFGVYIAKINNDLGVTNLTNIEFETGVSISNTDFRGWSENGNSFYLYKRLAEVKDSNESKISGYYEIYEVK